MRFSRFLLTFRFVFHILNYSGKSIRKKRDDTTYYSVISLRRLFQPWLEPVSGLWVPTSCCGNKLPCILPITAHPRPPSSLHRKQSGSTCGPACGTRPLAAAINCLAFCRPRRILALLPPCTASSRARLPLINLLKYI